MGNSRKLTERQKLVDDYLKGAVALYGFVTPRQFLLLFNRYNKPKLLKEELLKYANKLSQYSYDYYEIYENAIVNASVPLYKIDEINYLQEGKKYYIPTEEELLLRINPNYYEKTPQVKMLYDHFIKKLKINPLSVDCLMQKLIFLIITEERTQALMDLIMSYYEFKDINEIKETFELIMNVWNNTRKWANCGFTPFEVKLMDN